MNAAAGTDIVAVARVAALIEAHGSRFLDRWFTAAEVASASEVTVDTVRDLALNRPTTTQPEEIR